MMSASNCNGNQETYRDAKCSTDGATEKKTNALYSGKSEEQLPAIFQVRLDWFEGVAAL